MEQVKTEIEARREAFKDAMEAKREEVKRTIEARREELKTKLEAIRDGGVYASDDAGVLRENGIPCPAQYRAAVRLYRLRREIQRNHDGAVRPQFVVAGQAAVARDVCV